MGVPCLSYRPHLQPPSWRAACGRFLFCSVGCSVENIHSYLVHGSKFQSPGTWKKLLVTKYMEEISFYQVPGSKSQILLVDQRCRFGANPFPSSIRRLVHLGSIPHVLGIPCIPCMPTRLPKTPSIHEVSDPRPRISRTTAAFGPGQYGIQC